MTGTYTCELCGGTFPSEPGWTEEDRLAEMRENFGDIPEEDRASVCDDCYNEIKGRHPTEEELRPMREREERMRPIREAIDRGEPAPLKFNPKQAMVIKNMGPVLFNKLDQRTRDALMLPEKILEAVKYAIGYQRFRVALAISDWLLMYGGTTDDLVIEHGPNSSITVKHVDGQVICHAPGLKLEVVE